MQTVAALIDQSAEPFRSGKTVELWISIVLASLLILICTGALFAQPREEKMLVSYGGLGG